MVLNFGGSLFGGVFSASPNDGQVGVFAGQRIIPTDQTEDTHALTWTGDWSSATAYVVNDWVENDGGAYKCIQNHTNQEPPNVTYWDLVSSDTIGVDTVTLTPLEAALNTLELQQAAAITPGDYYGVKIDVFSDASGYLNTIDVGSTTATFSDDAYHNLDTSENTDTLYAASNRPEWSSITTTVTSNFNNIICTRVTGRVISSATNVTMSIVQSGNTLASRNIGDFSGTQFVDCYFSLDDYTAYGLIQAGTFTIVVTASGSDMQVNNEGTASHDGTLTDVAAGQVWSNKRDPFTFAGDAIDKKVQTDAITILSGFEKFHIIAFRPLKSGTGTVTADISFDGGSNYQTGVSLNSNLSIVNTGTSMILKINLNAGGSAGPVECKGWGVQLW